VANRRIASGEPYVAQIASAALKKIADEEVDVIPAKSTA
jgi:precorrin-6B methylase 1